MSDAERETPTVGIPTSDPPAIPGAAPTAEPTPPAGRRATVQVPVWLLAGVVVLALVVGAFVLGRATAPEGGSGPQTLADAVEMTASGQMEVGDFDARTLLEALSRNEDLDLGPIGNRILEQLGRR